MKFFYFCFFLFLGLKAQSYSQFDNISQKPGKDFRFDAIVFDSEGDSSRVDVFVMVPYQSLQFIKSEDLYGAKYIIDISFTDSLGNVAAQKHIKKSIAEENYYIAHGGTGDFALSQLIFYLAPGSYNLKVELVDELNDSRSKRARKIGVLDFDNYDYSTSGLMLVSAIEESGGSYKITPHLSDNLGLLKGGFFVFFESYNHVGSPDSIDFVYEFVEDGVTVASSNRLRRYIGDQVNRHYLRIEHPEDLESGQYTLRILSVMPSQNNSYSSNDIISISQRSVKYYQSFSGNVLENIDLAIRQLRYAAYPDEIEYIESAKNHEEKVDRFKEFWEERDPSPNTERNEAFEQFYSRVAFANRNFSSYADGWLTDKGMVYIVFGPPYNIERSQAYGGRGAYERWYYMNNREFLFQDQNGFGDWRLVSPMSVTEKYRYDG